MEKDTNVTEVIFRVWEKEIIALFPYNIYNAFLYGPDMIESYQHIGQHGSASYLGIIASSKPATAEQYRDLFQELETNFGYNLKVLHKRSYNKAIKAWNAQHQKRVKNNSK